MFLLQISRRIPETSRTSDSCSPFIFDNDWERTAPVCFQPEQRTNGPTVAIICSMAIKYSTSEKSSENWRSHSSTTSPLNTGRQNRIACYRLLQSSASLLPTPQTPKGRSPAKRRFPSRSKTAIPEDMCNISSDPLAGQKSQRTSPSSMPAEQPGTEIQIETAANVSGILTELKYQEHLQGMNAASKQPCTASHKLEQI